MMSNNIKWFKLIASIIKPIHFDGSENTTKSKSFLLIEIVDYLKFSRK